MKIRIRAAWDCLLGRSVMFNIHLIGGVKFAGDQQVQLHGVNVAEAITAKQYNYTGSTKIFKDDEVLSQHKENG